MKLLNNLNNIVLENSTPWYVKVFQSVDHESLSPLIKLFGGDIHDMYLTLDKMGKGEDFLKHITHMWPYDDQQLMYIIDALGGMRNWDNGMVDNDLMDEYVIDVYLNDMRYIHKDESGRIILELLPGEEAEFFSGGHVSTNFSDCREIAKQIFGDGLDWESYATDLSLDDLLTTLDEKNYTKLVRYVGTEFQNEEVDAWREEFDDWREEDQLPEGKVFITPTRMNGFLPDNEDNRYNFAVLLGNTPDLDGIVAEMQTAYGSAWNEVVQNQYYTEYYKAFDEFLGKPIGEGITNTYMDVLNPETGREEWKNVKVPVKYFDVTDRARAMIVRHAHDIDNPEDFIPMIQEFNMDILCPHVDEYPWEDEEVNDLFQDYLWEYL